MATYKEIRGSQIEAVATDPSNPVEGQVWYNTTSNVLKGQGVTTTGSWATVNSINQARIIAGGCGTGSAMLIAGGNSSFNNYNDYDDTEIWNGTNWTEVNDISLARAGVGVAGTTTAAIIYGGSPYPNYTSNVEVWNGTNWTETTNMNTARAYMGSAGQTSTAAMGFGGGPSNATEVWNGSNWTEVNDFSSSPSSNRGGVGANTTAALAFGGGPGYVANTESWNGSNWTETTNMGAPGGLLQSIGNSYTDCIAAGGAGASDYNTTVEQWNGSNWTEVADLPAATRAQSVGGNGSTTSGLSVAGQQSPGAMALVYEWVGPGSPQAKTIDTD